VARVLLRRERFLLPTGTSLSSLSAISTVSTVSAVSSFSASLLFSLLVLWKVSLLGHQFYEFGKPPIKLHEQYAESQ
jgi:hypothetical protein